MQLWQQELLLLFITSNVLIFFKGLYECRAKRNAYGPTYPLSFLGIFVWGDAVIFALFWTLVALASLILNDWILFLLIVSVFWLVRSVGETIYWFNQQYSEVIRYQPEDLPGFSIFGDDSIWFVYQIFNQCITVVSIIATIYITNIWLQTI